MTPMPSTGMDTAVQTGSRDGSIDRERVGIGVVDLGIVVGLVLLGNVEHGGNPIVEPLASLETVAPFVIGWIAVAALAGVYTRANLIGTDGLRLTATAWIAAANVGLMLRGSPLFEGRHDLAVSGRHYRYRARRLARLAARIRPVSLTIAISHDRSHWLRRNGPAVSVRIFIINTYIDFYSRSDSVCGEFR